MLLTVSLILHSDKLNMLFTRKIRKRDSRGEPVIDTYSNEVMKKLKAVKILYDQGILTYEEYEEKRKKLLSELDI